jgi:hypothetical protein
LQLVKGPLETNGLKEGAAGTAGEQPSRGLNHRHVNYTPLGHSGRIALRREQCDVFDWRPSLLGNRSRISSMDTLTTPVLLRYMVTNSTGKPVFLIVVLHGNQQ